MRGAAPTLSLRGTVPDARSWASALIGLYGPTGTEERMMAPLSPGDRPKAIATALLRFQAEGQPWNGRFFKAIMQKVVSEFARGDAGNVARVNEARTRVSQQAADQREADEDEADRSMAELWAWWEQVDARTKQLVDEEVGKRCKDLPLSLWRSVEIGVMQEFRTRPTGGPAA